jgi:hypothetical protein
MSPEALATAIVDRIEPLQTRSAAVLRAKLYEVLALQGLEVDRLVRDARMAEVAELEARAERAAGRARDLRARIAAGRLPPERLAEASARLAPLGVKEKAYREAVKRLERRPLPDLPSAPTRERLRHAGEAPLVRALDVDGSPLTAPRYELAWAVDRMSIALTAEEYQAAQRLREAHARRQATPRTVDLGGSGAGVPGPRMPVSDATLRAGREWNAIWHRLDPTLRLIVANFILEEAPRGRERPLTALEFGQMYGAVRDKATARGVATGAVKTTCAVIARLWREYDHWRSTREHANGPAPARHGARELQRP